MITLAYVPVQFRIRFLEDVVADVNPFFALRSVLGCHLRSLCCIARQNDCAACLYCRTCAYPYIFETILPADNVAQPGRDRASHPYAFTHGSRLEGREYSFVMTLFGQAAQYLPYIYAAFVRAGRQGLFKARVPFTVADVSAAGTSVLGDEGHIMADVTPSVWEYGGTEMPERQGQVLVELRTPLRFKVQGRYVPDFDAAAFMQCLFRRARTLCLLYGSWNEELAYPFERDGLRIADSSLRWHDDRHYSARQGRSMALGGVVGTLRLEGKFTPLDVALLEFGRIANAGKNTNFGLGQMDIWAKWE